MFRGGVAVVLLSLFFFALCSCAPSNTGRGLVLLDDLQLRNTHSLFFRSLESLYQLEYREATDPKLTLATYGDYLYDILVLFAPATEGISCLFRSH